MILTKKQQSDNSSSVGPVKEFVEKKVTQNHFEILNKFLAIRSIFKNRESKDLQD